VCGDVAGLLEVEAKLLPSGAVQPMSPVGPAMKPSNDTLEEAYQGYLGQWQPVSACGRIGSGHGHRGLSTRAGTGRR
jgi:hypothetical protein